MLVFGSTFTQRNVSHRIQTSRLSSSKMVKPGMTEIQDFQDITEAVTSPLFFHPENDIKMKKKGK